MTDSQESARTVVLVGHCGPDMHVLRNAAASFLPGVWIDSVNDQASLDRHLRARTLLLVNRVLDGAFPTKSGIELIADSVVRSAARAMLISNIAEAQDEAMRAGALRGFGKREVYDSATGGLLRAALEWPDKPARDASRGLAGDSADSRVV